MSTKAWLCTRRCVQQRADALMNERTAAKLLYRGKLSGGAYAGQYLGALLYSEEGCRHVLKVLDSLAEGKEVPVTLVTSERRLVQASWLKLSHGKLQRVQP